MFMIFMMFSVSKYVITQVQNILLDFIRIFCTRFKIGPILHLSSAEMFNMGTAYMGHGCVIWLN